MGFTKLTLVKAEGSVLIADMVAARLGLSRALAGSV